MLKWPKAGEPITESFLRELATHVARHIIGGKGIRVESQPGGIIIHNTQEETQSIPRWQPYNGE